MHWDAQLYRTAEEACGKSLKCPLFECREIFKDKDSKREHLITCQHLETAHYFCPSCQQVERFMPQEAEPIRHQSSVRVGARKLKRAASVLKGLSENQPPLKHKAKPDTNLMLAWSCVVLTLGIPLLLQVRKRHRNSKKANDTLLRSWSVLEKWPVDDLRKSFYKNCEYTPCREKACITIIQPNLVIKTVQLARMVQSL